MKIFPILFLALVIEIPLAALAEANGPDFSGNVRLYGERSTLSNDGPLARATSLSSTLVNPSNSNSQLDATLNGTWIQWAGSVTFRDVRKKDNSSSGKLVVNELTRSQNFNGIHGVAGKKVVSWDVGYAFKPNDLVQQEARRPVVERTIEGRPLIMLEGFGKDSAWSVVGFQKKQRPEDANPSSKTENMIAGRYYERFGAADLYGFGGWGSATRGTIGTAFSWVANDSFELHGSFRRVGRYQEKNMLLGVSALARTNPYVQSTNSGVNQALIGMTWTNEHKFSVIAESWYDGTAPSNGFWDRWQSRGQMIENTPIVNRFLPGSLNNAIAGNLGWQANQLGSGSLRRTNLFIRTSWVYEQFEPTFDVLYTPDDRGLVLTTGFAWKGERIRVDGGARFFSGSKNSLYAQTPFSSLFYLGLSVPF